MMNNGMFSNVDSMNQDPDFKNAIQTILPQILPYTPNVQNYEYMVNDINDLQREALKKIKNKVVAIVDGIQNEINFDQESELLKLLVDNDREVKIASTTTLPEKCSTIEYLLWILKDNRIKATVEEKQLVCWILFKSLSFKSVEEEFKKKGIGSCKSSLLHLNLSPKEGFPPIDPILKFIDQNCNKIEDLPHDIQMKLPQMKENMNSNDPDVLKVAVSFFQNIPVHLLIEWGLVSRCVNILAGEGVSVTALTTKKSDGYSYGRSYHQQKRRKKNDNVLKDDNLSLAILNLLYKIALDGEYGAAAIEEADTGLGAIDSYLGDQFGHQICTKSEFTIGRCIGIYS